MSTHTAERTTTFSSRPEAVWHAIMAPEVAPIIDPAVRLWQPDTEPPGVGTRFAIRGSLGGVPFRATSEVVSWELHRRAVLRSVKPSWPLRMVATHRTEPDGSGTRYTWRIDVTGPPPLSRVVAMLFQRAMAAQAAALTTYLDGDADGPVV